MSAIPVVIPDIIKKREETLLELRDRQARADACRSAIWHINATLAFCDENGDAREISRRYTLHERRLKHGAISNLVMSALRNASKPLTAREIFSIVTHLLGSKARTMSARLLYCIIRSTLNFKLKQGTVTCLKSHAELQTFRIVQRP